MLNGDVHVHLAGVVLARAAVRQRDVDDLLLDFQRDLIRLESELENYSKYATL